MDEVVTKIPEQPKTAKKSFAFVGETSSGKTTTVNSLFGVKLPTSPDANTTGTNKVFECEKDNYEVYDVYGTNDKECYHSIEKLCQLKTIHYIVFLIGTTFESNIEMYRLLSALSKQVIVLRNKTEDFEQSDVLNSQKKCQEHFGNVFKLFHVVAHPRKTNDDGVTDKLTDVKDYLAKLPACKN